MCIRDSMHLEESVYQQKKLIILQRSGELVNFAIEVGVLDNDNQLVTSDGNSVLLAQLSYIDDDLNKKKSRLYTLRGQTKTQAQAGIYTINELVLDPDPGSKFILNLTSTNGDLSRITKTLVINLWYKNCSAGEVYDSSTSICVPCRDGTYTIHGDQCLACPTQAFCKGGGTMIVNADYWRPNRTSSSIYPCQYQKACKGGPFSECGEGYEGPLCSACDEKKGFRKGFLGSCQQCQALGITLLGCLGVFFLYAFQIWYFRRSCFKAADVSNSRQPNQATSVIEKILATHLTSLSLLGSVNRNAPLWMQYPMRAIEAMGNFYAMINPVDCLLPKIAPLFYMKLVYLTTFPFVILAAYTPAWLLLRQRYNWSKDRFVATLIITVFLLQPSILRSLYNALQCRDYGDPDKLYLVEAPYLVCRDEENMNWIFFFIIPALLVWNLLIPGVLLFLLYRRRHSLEHAGSRIMLFFLHNGFTRQHYYWEFVILARKTILTILSIVVQGYYPVYKELRVWRSCRIGFAWCSACTLTFLSQRLRGQMFSE
eukprot:TRINITY_DN8213_c0_g1_i6.p1 TRINITY_DN8213_c0_g1~~TRINITY_DN8213_c0_g1_i6.p1  ORF type:complete len:572 (-),score=32.90 TRINITY_DN8213_c0_g1_i6:88-1707(-)